MAENINEGPTVARAPFAYVTEYKTRDVAVLQYRLGFEVLHNNSMMLDILFKQTLNLLLKKIYKI